MNLVNVFLLFLYYLPLEKGRALRLNKPKTPLPKDALCQNLVKIGPVDLERKALQFCQCIFTISFYLPFEKGGALHLYKLESPLPMNALYQVCLKLALPVVLEKKMKL